SIQNYNYDLMGRLTHADGDYLSGTNTYNRDYVYDDDNRIIQKTYENGMQYDFSYVANTHAISSVDITNGGEGQKNINFDYDDYGNMIKKEIYAGAVQLESTDYIYDENNRLKTLDDGIIELNFKYDNKGQRIKKVFEDEAAVVKETTYVNGFYTISDGRIDKHISDGNYIIASKIDDDSVNIKFYHQNHIGSTAALTDKDGEKFQAYLFYPYGEMWVEEESVADDDITRLFSGQEFDQESGLYYFNARYYDPHIGMFMRPDPAMAQLNHYAYAGCNPIMYNDPCGLDFGISAIVGLVLSIVISVAASAASIAIGAYSGTGAGGYDSSPAGAIANLAESISAATGANIAVDPQLHDLNFTSPTYGAGDPSYEISGTWTINHNYDAFNNNASNDGSLNASNIESTVQQSSNGGQNQMVRQPVRYFDQNEFDGLHKLGTGAQNTACHVTSKINELSEQYTSITGRSMTFNQATAMLSAGIAGGSLDEWGNTSSRSADFHNQAWAATGLGGSWELNNNRPIVSVNDIVFVSHEIYQTNRYGGPHFENSGSRTYFNTYTGREQSLATPVVRFYDVQYTP
ncbi:MAG: RHS repeat-associated core domain-containing protein, partial [Spirochaetes bacterium]|nr:RHS repeat-associated core domain-containing protein [Spirochaetota bacterium]